VGRVRIEKQAVEFRTRVQNPGGDNFGGTETILARLNGRGVKPLSIPRPEADILATVEDTSNGPTAVTGETNALWLEAEDSIRADPISRRAGDSETGGGEPKSLKSAR
jgi:hypothetical protein